MENINDIEASNITRFIYILRSIIHSGEHKIFRIFNKRSITPILLANKMFFNKGFVIKLQFGYIKCYTNFDNKFDNVSFCFTDKKHEDFFIDYCNEMYYYNHCYKVWKSGAFDIYRMKANAPLIFNFIEIK